MSRWYEEEDNGRLAWNDITECARVPAPNPWKDGIRVSAQPDMYPKGFTPDELNAVYWELSRGDGLDKLMEAASFEEFDSYYNPGTEYVEAAFITEALVIKKFARTEEVMRRGLVKALRRFLDAKDPTTGAPIELLDPIVGKPRKSGMYAYVTVQLPFSDGQVVSILFHAPEGDGKRITPQDTIVAFRWMLNKRDITNIVAPEEGKEVSVATIGRRLSLLVEKNTARFASTQKEAQEEQRELARINDRLKELEEEIQKVSDAIVQANLDLETEAAENGNTKALVERQKVTNAELRAKLEALQKAQVERDKTEADREPGETEVETETGENGVGGEETGAEGEDLHKTANPAAMQILQNARAEFWQMYGSIHRSWQAWTAGKSVIVYGPLREVADGEMTTWGSTLISLRGENAANELQSKLKYQGSYIIIPAKDDEEYLKLCLLNIRKGSEKRFQGRVRDILNADNRELHLTRLKRKFGESKTIDNARYPDAMEIWQEAQKLTFDELLAEGMSDEDRKKTAEEGHNLVSGMSTEIMLAADLAKIVPYSWRRGQNLIMRSQAALRGSEVMKVGNNHWANVYLSDLYSLRANREVPWTSIILSVATKEELAKIVFAARSRHSDLLEQMTGWFEKYSREEAIDHVLNIGVVDRGSYLTFSTALDLIDKVKDMDLPQSGAAPEPEAPETETPTDTTGETATDTTATEPSTEEPATENPVPDDPTVTADTVETEEPAATEEPAPAVEPEPTTEEPETVETEEPAADTPEFVKDLNDVLAGKYDDNLTRVTEIMRTAVTQMATPGMEQYQELANNASRYFSKLLAGAFAKKVA